MLGGLRAGSGFKVQGSGSGSGSNPNAER
jgi:hypothetical protein